MTTDRTAPPIQANGPRLEESGDNSSLRDRMDGILPNLRQVCDTIKIQNSQTQGGESDAGNV